MFKSLTARAIIPVTVSVTGFVIVSCILLYSIMKADMINDVIRLETNQAQTIVKSTRYAMRHDDRESLANIIGNIGTQQGVEHVRIFNKKGLIMFSSIPNETGKLLDKSAAGCIECHSGSIPAATLGDMKQARRFINEKGNRGHRHYHPHLQRTGLLPGCLPYPQSGTKDTRNAGYRSIGGASGQ